MVVVVVADAPLGVVSLAHGQLRTVSGTCGPGLHRGLRPLGPAPTSVCLWPVEACRMTTMHVMPILTDHSTIVHMHAGINQAAASGQAIGMGLHTVTT